MRRKSATDSACRGRTAIVAAVLALAVLGTSPARGQDVPPRTPPSGSSATPGAPGAPGSPASPDTPDRAAEKVVAAVAAGDQAALAALARVSDPDPWLVAEELCFAGKHDEAAAFAKAANRKWTAKLAGYVAGLRAAPPSAEHRKCLAEARAAMLRRDAAAIVALTDGLPGDAPGVFAAYLWRMRAVALTVLRRGADAEAAAQTGIARSKALGWVANESACLWEIARAALARGDRGAALAGFRGVEKLEADSDSALRRIRALEYIVDIHRGTGDVMRAFAVAEEMVRIAEADGSPQILQRAALQYSGCACSIDEFDKAVRVGDPALRSCDAETPPDILQMLTFVVGSAYAFGGGGNLDRGFELLQRYRDLTKDRPNPAMAAASFLNEATAWDGRGEPARALELLRQAVAMARTANDDRLLGSSLCNLSKAHERMRDLKRALETSEEALVILDRSGDRHTAAQVRVDTGRQMAELGRAAEGAARIEAALKTLDEIGDARMQADAWSDLAGIYEQMGEMDRAAAAAEKALAHARVSGSRFALALHTMNLAVLHAHMGRADEAAARAEEARKLAEELGNTNLVVQCLQVTSSAQMTKCDWAGAMSTARTMTKMLANAGARGADEISAGIREELYRPWTTGAEAAAQLGDAESLTYFLEGGRAADFGATLAARDRIASVALPPELREREAAARSREAAAAAKLRRATDSGKRSAIAEARAEHQSALADLLTVVARIRQDCSKAADVAYPVPATLSELRAMLRPEEAFVLFHGSGTLACALVVTPEGGRIVSFSGPKRIREAVESLRAGDRASDCEPIVAELRKSVADALGLEAKTKRLLISPAGQFSYLPFVLLFPDRELAYVPSGTTYAILRADGEKKGSKVLALGDPDYGARTEGVSLRGGERLNRLPNTAVEARSVGDVVLLGGEATERGFREALAKEPRWRAVHLACHGLVDVERPSLSALALTPTAEEDGLLRVADMFGLACPADLVVLSACETAVGRVFRAEGIVGMTRAFMFAGSPRVVVSLWKVDDAATAALMTKFYEELRRGAGAAKALRAAQEHVRAQEKWKHPAYWAAWTLWGLPE